MAVPVKYMVVKAMVGYRVIDTSWEGQGRSVALCLKLDSAHKVCAALNHDEGYVYPYPFQQ